jgi:hypothetical protein
MLVVLPTSRLKVLCVILKIWMDLPLLLLPMY